MTNKSALFGAAVNAPVVASLRVTDIQPDPEQPRKHFDKAALKELASTIKEKGLIQPIVVRTNPQGGYIIIAGERRWRAVQLNEADTIQAIVRDDLDARSAALIENIQRQNLKPAEEADAVARLIEEQNLSQGDVAAILGIGRASINQLLKIRTLPEELRAESLAMDTPKSILIELASVRDEKLVQRLWNRSKNEALSLHEIRRVRDAVKNRGSKKIEAELSHEERAIRQAFDALQLLKGRPLAEAERARLNELQAKISELLDSQNS